MQTDIGLVFNVLNINILQSTRPNTSGHQRVCRKMRDVWKGNVWERGKVIKVKVRSLAGVVDLLESIVYIM